jgi:uncharacterized membrane protein YkvA (DUF1232 family)
MPLTRNDVINAIGPVDDTIVAQVIGTGASKEELAEARAWVANDEAMMNAGRPLAGGRVARLLEILAHLQEEEQLDPERQ